MLESSVSDFLTTAQVAARLGVKVDTVYAYVSRGLLARVDSDQGRESRFRAADVARLSLRSRKGRAQRPVPVVIESALTRVEGDRLSYRGQDATRLAVESDFERVAELLWRAPAVEPFVTERAMLATAARVQKVMPPASLPIERLRVSAAVLAAADPLRFDTAHAPVLRTGRSLIAGMVESLPRLGQSAVGARLAARLLPRLTSGRPSRGAERLLNTAMVLCADQALSPSTLAVRIAAGQRADPYSVVQTGMGAMSGALHGAASLAAEDFLEEARRVRRPEIVIGARLRRRERIPGFGHRTYAIDPRARALLDDLCVMGGPKVDRVRDILSVMAERGLPAPNVDFALAALSHVLGMIRGSSEVVLCIARAAGWIGHALEEYASPTAFPVRGLFLGAAD